MIEIRPATVDDAYDLCLNLHEMTRNELDNARVSPGRALLQAKGAVEQGASAVVIDGDLAILAYSIPICAEGRATGFMAARCRDDRKLALGARQWAARERAKHPKVEFVAACFSTHPKRDRFMRALGMHKVSERPGFCLFSDSQPLLDKAQGLL